MSKLLRAGAFVSFCLRAVAAQRVLLVVALIFSACSKPARPAIEPTSPWPPTEQETSTPPTPVSSDALYSQPATNTATPVKASPEEVAATWERHYLATTEVDARLEILGQLRDLENTAAVQTFARLFQQAKDEEEKLDLLATLDQMEIKAGKLPIFEMAIHTEQPMEVRLAAVHSLAMLGEPEARQLLLTLTTNPNSELREAATEALKVPSENPEP